MYAIVVNGVITSVMADCPSGARRLDDNSWFEPAAHEWTADEMAVVGMMVVVDVPKPADTATQTSDCTYQMVNGLPTMVWTMRNKTAEELSSYNEDGITNRLAQVHLVNMLNLINTTNATINAGPAPYMKDIARAIRSLIKKELRDFSSIE